MIEHAPALRLLFSALRDSGYEWTAQTPDRLLAFRKAPDPFRPLAQLFGLGVSVRRADLVGDGLPEALIDHLEAADLVAPLRVEASIDPSPLIQAKMAVSGSGDVLVVHDHWPPKA